MLVIMTCGRAVGLGAEAPLQAIGGPIELRVRAGRALVGPPASITWRSSSVG